MIQFPLKRQELCRPYRAKAVVFSFAAVALALYNFAIWTSGVMPLSELYFDKPFCQVRAHDSLLCLSIIYTRYSPPAVPDADVTKLIFHQQVSRHYLLFDR